MQGKVIYEFGQFRLDPREHLLSRQGQPVSLSPQLFSLLLVFVENAGHLLSKEELKDKVWGQAYVSEAALKVIVGNLRKALGDGQNGLRYIENVRGGGYRFVAEVRKIEVAPEPLGKPALGEKPRAAHKGLKVISLLAVLALTAIFALRLTPAPQLRVARYVPLTSNAREKGGPLLTDGARVYFAEKGPNGLTLATVAVAGGGTAIVPLSVDDAGVYDLSPLRSEVLVGRFMSNQEGNELWVVPLLGGSPRRIGDLRADTAGWSPDGRQIAIALHKNLYVANADGAERRKIAEVLGQALWPRWSPDGKTLRFTENNYRNGDVWESIWEVGSDGSNLHPLLEGWNNPPRECCGSWTPDGRFFVFQSTHEGRTDLWTLSERQSSFGKDSRLPVRLSSGLQGYSFPVVSPDGKQVFAVGIQKRGELVRYDSKVREFVPFLGGISATWVSFSKSGRSVAYIDYADLTVWRANSDGSQKTQITFSPLQVDGFSWSPDEKWLALRARTQGKPWMIYLVPSHGGDIQLMMPAETEQGVPTWSADGRSIAFGDVPLVFGKASGAEAIHIWEVNSHKLSELPGSRGLWTARWSPDGRFLAALTIEGQRLMLYDFGTKRWRPTKAENVNNPTWSGDGKYIYFDTEGGDRALCRVSVADGHAEQLASLHSYPNLAWWWSGVTPDNSPLILRNLGTTEIYSLTLESR